MDGGNKEGGVTKWQKIAVFEPERRFPNKGNTFASPVKEKSFERVTHSLYAQ
jgi:hypothetical protein